MVIGWKFIGTVIPTDDELQTEIINPNPIFIDAFGAIIDDRNFLAQGGKQVVGAAAADGVTQVLLRTKVSEHGTVEYCLDDGFNVFDDGGFAALGMSSESSGCIDVPVD